MTNAVVRTSRSVPSGETRVPTWLRRALMHWVIGIPLAIVVPLLVPLAAIRLRAEPGWNNLFPREWPLAVPEDWPDWGEAGINLRRGGTCRSLIGWQLRSVCCADSNTRVQFVADVERVGWPFPFLEGELLWEYRHPAGARKGQRVVRSASPRYDTHVLWHPTYNETYLLPSTFVVSGYIASVTTCSAVLWISSVAGSVLYDRCRRRRRLRRGCCPRCAYPFDFEGRRPCSECGFDLTTSRNARRMN
jgi:hypothetical protein